MALQLASAQNSNDDALTTLRKQVIDAVKVIFNRAVANGLDAPEIEDSKDDLPASGTLQDCEFGMIILLVNEWFREQQLEDEFFEIVKSSDFEAVVVALVRTVVARVIDQKQDDEGGEGNQSSFFTGEPYTKYPKGRGYKFSAHLDAAMITLAFLAPAVKQFNEHLSKSDHGLGGLELPNSDWMKNLRDAALYVILDGLKYAKDCRVMHNGKFQGFTSDPGSNAARPHDGSLEHDKDRLFFTWTACETINDMKQWRASYLDDATLSPPLPEQVASELKVLIKDLDETLDEAAGWCKDHFLPGFEKFKVEEVGELVQEVNGLGGKKFDESLNRQIEELATSVQHVYHMSQYAAIRSLVPERVTIEEVRTVSDKLDRLVTITIMNSELDRSPQKDLFLTLTRTYSLGQSNPKDYPDDAWYPLVVRSLSGLLSRTLTDISKRFSRGDVSVLTASFQRSLETHVSNLIARRPKVEKEGDRQLWSYALNQPYVLYATQRTIFALMQYATFLHAVEQFQSETMDPDKREEELTLLVARKLATDYLRPVIREMLTQVQVIAQQSAPSPTLTADQSGVALPEEPWAANVVRNWLASFTEDFKRSQVAANLTQRSQSLRLIKKYAENYKPSESLERRKREGAERQLEVLIGEYQNICKCEQVGERLARLEKWEDGELTAILFEYLFRNYLERPVGSFEELLEDDKTELWKLIQEAMGSQDTITKLDPTATVL